MTNVYLSKVRNEIGIKKKSNSLDLEPLKFSAKLPKCLLPVIKRLSILSDDQLLSDLVMKRLESMHDNKEELISLMIDGKFMESLRKGLNQYYKERRYKKRRKEKKKKESRKRFEEIEISLKISKHSIPWIHKFCESLGKNEDKFLTDSIIWGLNIIYNDPDSIQITDENKPRFMEDLGKGIKEYFKKI